MNANGPRRLRKILLALVALLLLLVVAGVLVLDRLLASAAHKEAARFSEQLHRPIAIEGVTTRLWGGLGVKVTGLSVGPGPGEGVPLLELSRAEVSVALVRAVLSGGKRIRVSELVLHGLRVNVEKLASGETNLERLAKQVGGSSRGEKKEEPPPSAKAGPGGTPAALSLEVGRAALEEARVSFINRSVPGAKELYLDHLDAEVRDLAPGKPLELLVKAAVLASERNLLLRVKTAPLSSSLSATPEEVTLQIAPIDLTPLAPFLPKGLGFLGGRLEANLALSLGALVKGGKGPTHLRGGFKARQLSFLGQLSGKRLDASLDADLDADATSGDLDLRKLDLELGPMGLTGEGRASGLFGGAPRIEGLALASHGLDFTQLREYYPPLRAQLGGALLEGPLGVSLRAKGTAAQEVELKVDLTPLRMEVPHQLSKSAGAPLTLLVELGAAQNGGRLSLQSEFDLTGVDLRPGGTIAKKPGDPLAVKLAASVERSSKDVKVELLSLAVNVLGDTLAAKGTLALSGEGKGRTTRFDAEVSGEKLDLDRLLLASSGSPKPAPKTAAAPGKKPLEGGNPFAGLSGEARMKIGLLRVKGAEVRLLTARVKVQEDQVTLSEAKLNAFGGSADASGTRVKLIHPEEPFKVSARLSGMSAEEAETLFTSHKVISGEMDADLELTGTGKTGAEISRSLNGTLKGTLRNGAFHGKDLVAGVADPLAGKLPFAKKLAEGGSTSLGKELPFSLVIADGMARLEKPVSFETGEGKAEVSGGVHLDGTLEMPATVALSPR